MTEQIPNVVAIQISDKQIKVDCPHCGKEHFHGTGSKGHQNAVCNNGSYNIVNVIKSRKGKQ